MLVAQEKRGTVRKKVFPRKNPVLPRIIADHLGSIRVTLDQNGNIDSWTDYYPFGKEARGSSTSNRPKEQFTGKECDSEIGLDYFGARYYNAEIGRWTSVDPVSGKYPFASPYNYTLNNPVFYVDPDGQEVRGDKKQLEEEAKVINKGIKDAGLEGASVSVQSKEVEKTGLSGLFAKVVNALGGNVSTTETVHYLQIEGEGWNALANGQSTTGSDTKDRGLNMLSDLLRSETVFNLQVEQHSEHGGFHTGGELSGNTIIMDTQKETDAAGLTRFAVFMHELVGHGHPASKGHLNRYMQDANVIGRAFGNAGKMHDHLSRPGHIRGGYNGYPVVLPPKLVPANGKKN